MKTILALLIALGFTTFADAHGGNRGFGNRFAGRRHFPVRTCAPVAFSSLSYAQPVSFAQPVSYGCAGVSYQPVSYQPVAVAAPVCGSCDYSTLGFGGYGFGSGLGSDCGVGFGGYGLGFRGHGNRFGHNRGFVGNHVGNHFGNRGFVGRRGFDGVGIGGGVARIVDASLGLGGIRGGLGYGLGRVGAFRGRR